MISARCKGCTPQEQRTRIAGWQLTQVIDYEPQLPVAQQKYIATGVVQKVDHTATVHI